LLLHDKPQLPQCEHNGKIAVPESNQRWCSDSFEFGCDDAGGTRKFARELNMEACTTAVSSPQSNCMDEWFVKTMNRAGISLPRGIPAPAGIVNLSYKSCLEIAGQDHVKAELCN
jgi:putative hemolysin